MRFPDTWNRYDTVERDPIQYTYCVDYKHISRYRSLRQVVHQGLSSDRFVALETVNPISNITGNIKYYTVPANRENRLDLIAYEQLGSAQYAWVIAYMNRIQDGFTALQGTQLVLPSSLTSLFEKGQLLASVTVNKLQLGSE